MKILLTADVHIEHASAGAESILLKTLEKTVKEESPDALFILGDLFDAFGKIQSPLAVSVKETILRIAESGTKVVIIAGNHDYVEVEPSHFGYSIVSALFSGLESLGIYVIDQKARFIDIGGHKLLGIPYRENWEQFEETCLRPIEDYLQENGYAQKTGEDEIVNAGNVTVGWHCGLPFGEWEIFGGDENENGWIREGHPAVELLMDLATDKTIYLGHYHKPTDVIKCLDGGFMYVGSPVTRSRSESGEVKRFLLLDTETGERKEIDTGLNLDQSVESVEQAEEYINAMKELFGDEIESVLRLSVILPEGSSISDYQEAVGKSKGLPNIKIDRPIVAVNSPLREHKGALAEAEAFRLAIIEYYKGKNFRYVSVDDFVKLGGLGLGFWTSLIGKEQADIDSALNGVGLKKLDGKITDAHIETMMDYSLAVIESENTIKSF